MYRGRHPLCSITKLAVRQTGLPHKGSSLKRPSISRRRFGKHFSVLCRLNILLGIQFFSLPLCPGFLNTWWQYLKSIAMFYRIKCILCTPRPIYQSTYRPIVDRCIGRHINRHSADISTEICRLTYQPIHRPQYRLCVQRHIVQLLADIAAETRPIRWPLTVGGISVDCRWYIGQLCPFHAFLFSL